jgi:photosystem II stability/assembly factor-like uncharacterized protein
MKVLRLISLFCILSLIPTRSGAQITWQQTKGPEGGAVSAVCVDSINHILICTKAGGIFESGDSGAHWLARNAGLPTLFFHNLEAGSRGYSYAMSNSYGIFRMKREDNPSWVSLDTTADFAYAISDMAVDELGSLFIATNSYGILVSHDNGDHFTAANVGIDSLDLTKKYAMKYLAIGIDGRMYALSTRKIAYSSTDRGEHWTALAKSDSIGEPFSFYSLPNGSLLVGDVKGKAYLLTEGGTWQSVLRVDTSDVYDFFYSPKSGHTFARYSNGLLFRSTDMGVTWGTVSDEIEGGEYFPTAVTKDGIIFSGIDYDGMVRSFDDGESFEMINRGLIGTYIGILQVDAQNNLYANSNERIYRSSDQGQNWEMLNLEIHDIHQAPIYSIDSAGVIYANDKGFIDVSSDNGQAWSRHLQSPRPEDQLITYALASTKEKTFAATDHGMFVTLDHGQTWKSVSVEPYFPDSSSTFITLVIGRDGALYTQNDMGALYKSSDGGVNWGAPVGRSGLLQIVMQDGMTMFRANNERVERSTNAGQDWTTLSVDTLREAQNTFLLFGVSIDDKNQLFACSGAGIFISKDLGETWIPSSEGFHGPVPPQTPVLISGASSVCQDRLGNYFASSHGQGVFISAAKNAVKRSAAGMTATLQCYPNPVVNRAELSFALEAPTTVRYEIVDVTGRIVSGTSSTMMSSGEHTISLDVSALASGSYLCTLVAGNERRDVWISVTR